MAETANTAWYRQGTVSITNGTTKVTGVGTHFTTAGINPGATLRIDDRPYAYEVASVVSDTEIQLARAYYGGTVSAASYSIDRNFQSTTNARLAADVSDLVGIYEDVRDGVYLTIEGKSAYQVAVKNGYTGTEAQWLESLKADKEWQTLDDRSGILKYNSAWAHNSYYRGKNLGTTISDKHLAAIRAGTFEDIYVGDYFSNTGALQVKVLGCNCFKWQYKKNGQWLMVKNHIVVSIRQWSAKRMNLTATTEGGLYHSYMHDTEFPKALAIAEGIAGGGENIVPLYARIADAVDASTGKPTHFIQSDEKIFIPTTAELFGFVHANTSYPEHKMQLPYFRYCMEVANINSSLNWTDMAASATQWYGYGETVGGNLYQWLSVTNTISSCELYFLIG